MLTEPRTILAGFFVLEGIACGALAVILLARQRTKLAAGYRLRGEIVSIEESRDGEGSRGRLLTLRYRTLNGEDVTCRAREASLRSQAQVGGPVEILVDPNDPATVQVVSFMGQWRWPFILALAAAGSLINAPVVYFLVKT